MKKAKIISIVVIMLSVIALGVFMGKQMFKLMEAGADQPVAAATGTDSAKESTVKVLYNINSSENTSTGTNVVLAEEGPLPVSAKTLTGKPETPVNPGGAPSTAQQGNEPGFEQNGPKWYAYASGNGTNVRSGPSTGEKLLFKVSKGTRGVVTEKRDGWTSVKWDFNRKTGWVRDDLLLQGPATVMVNILQKSDDSGKIDTNEIAKAAAQQAIKENLVSVAIAKPAPASETVNTYVQGQPLPENGTIEAPSFANIRSEPSTTSEKVGKLPKGMAVKIKSTRLVGKWRWFEVVFNEGRKTGWTREDNLKF
ncbi:hypothetical protein MASR1M12_32190 [Erysipelotrichia bacterium]